MEMWCAHAVRDRESEFDHETVKRLACCAWVHRAAAVEGEQRLVPRRGVPALDVASDELADVGPVRNQAALAVMRISA